MVTSVTVIWCETNNEVDRNIDRALMQKLEKGVLRVRPNAAPDDRRCLVFDTRVVESDSLAVAFHLQLLQIGWQELQSIVVRDYRP